MILSGRVSDAGLMARLRSGEELELAGAFSEGIYFTGPGGMVMLHDTRYGCLPFGVAIPGFSGLSRAVGANCGERASLRPEGIFSPGTGLCIYTDFEPVPSPAAVRPSLENLESLRERFTSALGACGRSALLPYCGYPHPSVSKAEIRDEFARAGFEALCLLGGALGAADAVRVREALQGLLGLGRGLTPSFDDFITGLLVTLEHASSVWGLKHPALGFLAQEVSALAPLRTNRFSAAYLLAAARGGDFSLMRNCLELRPSADSLTALLGVGSSSGSDMLCGMVYALGAVSELLR